jgi:hypothetical protein
VVGAKPKLKVCFEKGYLPRGLKLEKELLQGFMFKRNAPLKDLSNFLLKIAIGAS